MAEGARQSRCAEVLGLSERTLQRWRRNDEEEPDGRTRAVRPVPGNALSEEERAEVLRQCNRPENASKPPAQIVVELADQGIYLASESTFYRILRSEGQQHHRGRARAPRARKPRPTHRADAPNEVWCWDITWLPSHVAGLFFKLYLILDLFSRKIVASEVWAEENAEHSQTLLRRAALAENLAAVDHPVVLHGDNGSPLKAGTVYATMHALGFSPSHSRPRVSNDNPHAEALFRTAKYHPSLPAQGFADLDEARRWAASFVHAYNHLHRHSALRFVTPAQKHAGEDKAILARRKALYENARRHRPERWVRNATRNWTPVTFTTLNPIDPKELEPLLKKSA
jgi:transposase InsO family protein